MPMEREEIHRLEIMAQIRMAETEIPVTDVRVRELFRTVTDAREATETLTEMEKDSVVREILRMARENRRTDLARDVRMATDVRVVRAREALVKTEKVIAITDVRPLTTEEMTAASR